MRDRHANNSLAAQLKNENDIAWFFFRTFPDFTGEAAASADSPKGFDQ
ncbi:MAG: hypothetical protein KGK01_16145 [Bradyrhizobium sp.]|nr:hypothetical protein [Pseudomonadota bacterium]MDE2243897.1 hypothetical protein [Bradyrhizobium sp.]MDE2468521.1 hypothetical protein [Bradyrhizobium sp.]